MKGLIILDFNRTLFNPETNSLFPGVIGFLNKYSKSYLLALIGKGGEKRANLIEELDIKKYFDYFSLIEEKSEEDFLKCLRGLQVDKTKVWSIGDRVKKEIMLSNKVGVKTVWFRNGKFANETPAQEIEKPTFTISSFEEISGIIPL
jgi:putative hydrolase of the HAD superfamily